MSKMTSDEARDLAQSFQEASALLGEYRFSKWKTLSKSQRATIEGMEWTLLNYSSDLVTQAVGISLDDAQASVADLERATSKAKNAIKTISNVRKAIKIAGALVTLGAAVATADAGAIASAIGDLLDEVA